MLLFSINMDMKKVYRKLVVILFLLLCTMVCKNKSEATSATISVNKDNVTIGENVTVTVSYEACLCQLEVSGAGLSDNIDYIGTDLKNKKDSKNYNVDTSKLGVGTHTILLKGQVADENRQNENINTSATIIVSKKNENPTPAPTATPTAAPTPKPTTTPTPTTEEKFKDVNDTVYAQNDNINIRKSNTTSSDSIGKLKAGESITRIGVGTTWSKIKYNGAIGYVRNDMITTEAPNKTSDKALKTLTIKNGELTPSFNPDITNYELIIKEDVEKLDIKAEPNDEKAKVEIKGNENLTSEGSVVKVLVTAQDGTVRTYIINVKKENETTTETTTVFGLSSLNIPGYTLSPKFTPENHEYTLKVSNPSVTKLDVTAIASSENARVEIEGNENLVDGENVIIVTVLSEDSTEKAEYKIKVNKATQVVGATTGTTKNKKGGNKDNIVYIGIIVAVFVTIMSAIIIISKKRNKGIIEDDYEEDGYEDGYEFSSNNKSTLDETADIYRSFDISAKDEISDYNETEPKNINENEIDSNIYNDLGNTDYIKSDENIFGKLFPQEPEFQFDNFNNSNNTNTNFENLDNNKYEDLYKTYSDFSSNTDIASSMKEYADLEESQATPVRQSLQIIDEDDDAYRNRRTKGKHSK